MSGGILLTQIPVPCATEQLDRLGARGEVPMVYRPAGWTHEYALVQIYSQDVEAVDLGVLPASVEGGPVARHLARLCSDTGAAQESAPILMIVAFDVPARAQAEVEQWYSQEHIPMLMRAPGWLRARRYETIRAAGPRRFTSIALHELRSLEVLDSPERALARSTPWRARLEQDSWFREAGRFAYQRST